MDRWSGPLRRLSRNIFWFCEKCQGKEMFPLIFLFKRLQASFEKNMQEEKHPLWAFLTESLFENMGFFCCFFFPLGPLSSHLPLPFPLSVSAPTENMSKSQLCHHTAFRGFKRNKDALERVGTFSASQSWSRFQLMLLYFQPRDLAVPCPDTWWTQSHLRCQITG